MALSLIRFVWIVGYYGLYYLILNDAWNFNIIFINMYLCHQGVQCPEQERTYGGDFRRHTYFGGCRGCTFFRGNILVCVVVRTLLGSIDSSGVVQTCWG